MVGRVEDVERRERERGYERLAMELHREWRLRLQELWQDDDAQHIWVHKVNRDVAL